MRKDGMHSLQWYLVVISEAHPGLDGRVRVVTTIPHGEHTTCS